MAQKQVPSDSWTIHAKWAAASPAWQLERVARGVGEATFPCPQSAQSETLYVKFCYPVRVVNKCNRMPPFSLLWADPTGPLQSIVVVALAAAGATPLSSLPSELLLSRAKKTFLVLCPPLEARSYPANSFKCCLCFSCCCRRCVVAAANVGAASVCFSVFALVFVLKSTYSPPSSSTTIRCSPCLLRSGFKLFNKQLNRFN